MTLIIKNMWAISMNQELPDIPEGDFSCFFIVNSIDDKSFIHSLTTKLIAGGCKELHFFGKHENTWHLEADIADIDLGGVDDDSIFTPTNGYKTEAEFRQELVHHYVDLNDEDHKYYLFSDDDKLLESVCRYVKEMDLWGQLLEDRIVFAEKVLSDLGAKAVGEIEFNSHRFDISGNELFSADDASAKTIWQFGDLFIVIDTIMFPDTPCLILEISDSFDGEYEDVDPFPFNLSDEDITEEIRLEILREQASD